MTAAATPPGELEPIETASEDELRSLQLDEMKRQGIDPARCSLKYGIFGAEPWTNEMRAEIEALAGLDATDIYGLSEGRSCRRDRCRAR